MNGNGYTHPARSVDFLSRLYDGELEADERARFEAHRAHCAECRHAAVEFEDALSLFRSARSTPPRSDLAARILRKVQTTNRPRVPFPLRFRIDLGWAALLLTALFALLITTPIAVRQNATAPPPAPPPAPKPAASPPLGPPIALPREKGRLADTGPAAPRESRENAPIAGGEAAAPKVEPQIGKTLEREESAATRRQMSGVGARVPQPTSAGGEGEAVTRPAGAPSPLHLSIHEADGFGAPPPLLSEPRIELPPAERGHEYLLLVDSQGIVRKVSPRVSREEAPGFAPAPPQRMSRAQAAAPRPLAELRFQAGSRPRRLLVRIE